LLNYLSDITAWLASQANPSQANLLLPLAIALWIAWGDLRTYRIPNYLTLGAALAGLLFQAIFFGWNGVGSGILGLVLGFFLLFPVYVMGGMGAGDVKALAALGAWLGPGLTLMLFCYMAGAGGLIALGMLIYKGLLWTYIRRGWSYVLNWILFRPSGLPPAPATKLETKGIPYGAAIALGMVVIFWRGG